MAISLDKVYEKSEKIGELSEKASISLEKFDLQNIQCQVALALDYSGSMRKFYKNGSMQRLCEKVLALSTRFDDDGEVQLFFFDTVADYMGDVTLDNYDGYIDRVRDGRHMGRTNYAEAIRKILEEYNMGQICRQADAGLQPRPMNAMKAPVFVVFLTDGSPDSKAQAKKMLRAASYAPMFLKFISIGDEEIEFLQKLDDLDGRYVDNANYHSIGDVDSLTDSELFDALLDELKQWHNFQTEHEHVRI